MMKNFIRFNKRGMETSVQTNEGREECLNEYYKWGMKEHENGRTRNNKRGMREWRTRIGNEEERIRN